MLGARKVPFKKILPNQINKRYPKKERKERRWNYFLFSLDALATCLPSRCMACFRFIHLFEISNELYCAPNTEHHSKLRGNFRFKKSFINESLIGLFRPQKLSWPWVFCFWCLGYVVFINVLLIWKIFFKNI